MDSVEERLAKVEQEVAELRARANVLASKQGWVAKVVGSFEDDEDFDEILRLGREERKSDVLNEK
jgi:hypothetical protein